MKRKLIAAVGVLFAVRAGADGPVTQIADVIVPEIFTPSAQLYTEQKSRLIQSGVVARDTQMDALLSGAGLTFNVPHFRDLDDDEENISTDDPDDSYKLGSAGVTSDPKNSKPKKIGTGKETAVRMSRNQSWASADLASALTDKDPMDAIAQRVGAYWARRLQAAFIATCKGMFAMNDASPSNGSTHTAGDMTNDVKGSGFSKGVTNFTASAFLDALITMGDSDTDLGMVMVHSIVFNTMRKNNLIDYIPDATGQVVIPTYLGRTVITDDSMPHTGGVFETWIFGAGSVRLGMGSPKTPTETERKPGSGNGGGSEVLYNRVEWLLHINGHQYIGTAPSGGPSNAATSNNLASAASWIRSFNERKQIKIARLVTREY